MATQVKKGIAPKKNVTAKPKIKAKVKPSTARQKPKDDELGKEADKIGIRIVSLGSFMDFLADAQNNKEANAFRERIKSYSSGSPINGTQELPKDYTNIADSVKTSKTSVKPALESMVEQLYDNNVVALNYIEQIETALNKIHINQPKQLTNSVSETIKEEITLLDKFNSRLNWQNSLNARLFNILQQLNDIA